MPTTSEVLVASAIVVVAILLLASRALFLHHSAAYVASPAISASTLNVSCVLQGASLPNASYQQIGQLDAALYLYVKNTYPWPVTVDKVVFVKGLSMSATAADWTLGPWGYGMREFGISLVPPSPTQFYANPGDVFEFTGSSAKLVESGVIAQYYEVGVPNQGVPSGYANPFGAKKQLPLGDQWPLVYGYLTPNSYAATSVVGGSSQDLFVLSNFEPAYWTKASIPYYLQVSAAGGNYGVYFEYGAPAGGRSATGVGLVSQYNPAGQNLASLSGNIYYAYFVGNGAQLLYVNNETAPVASAAGPASLGSWEAYLGVARLGQAARPAPAKPILTFYDIVSNGQEQVQSAWGSVWTTTSASWTFIEDVLYANLTWCRYEIVTSNPGQLASLWLSYGPLYALNNTKYSLQLVGCGIAAKLQNDSNPVSALSYNSPFAVYVVSNPSQAQYVTEQMPVYNYSSKGLSNVPIGTVTLINFPGLPTVTIYGSGPMNIYQYEGTAPATFYVPAEPGAELYYLVFYNPFPGNGLEQMSVNPNYVYATNLWGSVTKTYSNETQQCYNYTFWSYCNTQSVYISDTVNEQYSNSSVNMPYYAPYVVGLAYFPGGTWRAFDYSVVSNQQSYGSAATYTEYYYEIVESCSWWGCWPFVNAYQDSWGYGGFQLANFTPVPVVGDNYVGPSNVQNGQFGTWLTNVQNGVYYPFNYVSFTYNVSLFPQAAISKPAYVGSDVYYLGLFTGDTITIEGVPPGYKIELSVPGKTVNLSATSSTVVVNLLNYFTAYELVEAEEDGGILVTLVPPPNDVLAEVPDMILVHLVGEGVNMVVPAGLKVESSCTPVANSTSPDVTLVIQNVSRGYYEVYIDDGGTLTPVGLFQAVAVQVVGGPFTISVSLASTTSEGGYDWLSAGGTFTPSAPGGGTYVLQSGDVLSLPSGQLTVSAPVAVVLDGGRPPVLIIDGEALTFGYEVTYINVTGIFNAAFNLVP